MYAASGMAQGMQMPPQNMSQPTWMSSEDPNLSAEVGRLRETLEREQADTTASFAEYSKRIDAVTQENKRLTMKLMRSQLRDSAKDSEVAVVKKEVLEKTAAIEQVMRDLMQKQQATLARVQKVASSMVTTCSAPSPERSNTPAGSPAQVSRMGLIDGGAMGGAVPGFPKLEGGMATSGPPDALHMGFGNALPNGRSPSAASSPPRSRQAPGGSRLGGGGGGSPGPRHGSPGPGPRGSLGSPDPAFDDAEEHRWFQSVKANLEHYGNVEVFSDHNERDCSCCLESMGTPYGIRPRMCGHSFHIECLLQWWTEGTCPVCSASFAPEADNGSVRPRDSQSPLRPGSPGGSGAMPSAMPSRDNRMTRPAGAPGPGTFGGGQENSFGFRQSRP